MAEHLKLKNPVNERPQAAWGSIATELAGSQTRFVKGERWTHRVIEKGDPEAPPLFLYHGVGGYAEPYARVLPALSRDFRVFAVDALYHGYSSKEPWDPANRTALQAAAYVDLIHALGYEKAIYEGESMGASIGFEIGMLYPESLDKLILNGYGRVATKRTEWKKQPFKGDLYELSRAAVLDPSYENVQKRLWWLVHDNDDMNDEMIRMRMKIWSEPEVNASLRRVFGVDGADPREAAKPWTEEEVKAKWKVKDTLVVYGTYNPQRGPDYGEYGADLIGAKFYEFKDCGHWPMWESPDEYVEALRSYLL
ncbi:alpha/beta fold hydrolase [Phenylobacterium immobile]|uniref:alpha/beta fold hydrolase n=1 Tax=Phenylobacterium immobile TaxID=21 RepID=UPI000B2AA6BB|nr:alpha/beta hydrolase [Phenylobacterium immobile]